MLVRVPDHSVCVLVEYVKDNYYARFYISSYHRTGAEIQTLIFYST